MSGPSFVCSDSESLELEHHACECQRGDACMCSAEGVFSVVGKKWTICIVSLLGSREAGYRFNELKDGLDGVTPKALSDRLKELQEHGVVNRSVIPDETPPMVNYTLTEKGRKLRNAIQSFLS